MAISHNSGMDGPISEIGFYLLATLAGGAAIGWVIRSALSHNQVRGLNEDWQSQLDDGIRQRDLLTAETETLRVSIEAALEKENLLTRNVFSLRAEREDFKSKMGTFQSRMAALQRQSKKLQSEFIKSGEFYKGELTKAFERRRLLEEKIENSKDEYESFSNHLRASRSEHESVNKMLIAAKTRLDNLDALEQNVIELEAENAQLKHDGAITRQDNDALQRDVFEHEELKIQNKELAEVLKSMENSRKQYENDANRYRKHAGKSEQKSETLRIRLDEVEKNFTEMETQQARALEAARKSTTTRSKTFGKPAKQEKDDLKEIIGVGKVFEHTLHELGIINFRQVANFRMSDIAHVNSELKEFKGRMEQDDWIGQAKDLLFKKYGNA